MRGRGAEDSAGVTGWSEPTSLPTSPKVPVAATQRDEVHRVTDTTVIAVGNRTAQATTMGGGNPRLLPAWRKARVAAPADLRDTDIPGPSWPAGDGASDPGFTRAGSTFILRHQARGSGETKADTGKDHQGRNQEESQGRSAGWRAGRPAPALELLGHQGGRTRGRLHFPKPELDEDFQSCVRCPGLDSPLTKGEQMRAFSQ